MTNWINSKKKKSMKISKANHQLSNSYPSPMTEMVSLLTGGKLDVSDQIQNGIQIFD